MIPAAVVLALLAQQPADPRAPEPRAPEPTPKQKRIEATIGQIRRLAASEPVAFGIDTRIRTANVLPGSYDARAVELLRDDESELAGIADRDEQSALRVRIAAAWARFDLEQAERSIQPLRRTEQHDYPAEAYDQLYIRFEQQPELARAIVMDGLKAGAFRMTAASRLLEGFANKDRAAAVTLFAAVTQAFPSTSCFPADVIYLLDQVKFIGTINPGLAQEALKIAISTALSEKFDSRQRRQVVAVLGPFAPELLNRVRTENVPDPLPADQASKELGQENLKTLDIAGLSYSDALSQSRAIEALNDRAEKLIELSRREDLTADQRTSVASEALHLLAEAPITSDRLVGIAMIARDFARRSEGSMAALAAQMLAERFRKACDCGNANCTRDHEQFDCLASVQDFAEYLDEFKVSPESMGLSNISLEARLLILELKTLLASR